MGIRNLMLVRHAKSDWANNLLSDFDRPLNGRGEKDIARIAKWLKKNNCVPDLVISSPARRAEQTAQAVIKTLALPENALAYNQKMYLADNDTLVSIVNALENKYLSVMLIGHNPGLENLVQKLCRDALPVTADGKLMTTANFVLLRFKDDWADIADQQGDLIYFIRPKDLG